MWDNAGLSGIIRDREVGYTGKYRDKLVLGPKNRLMMALIFET